MVTPGDWQIGVGDLLLGSGTAYAVDPDGMDGIGMPALRTSDVDRALDHGQRWGRDLLSGRTISFTVTVLANTSAESILLLHALSTNTAIGEEIELSYKFPGQDVRMMTVRSRRKDYAEDQMARRYNTIRIALQFHAVDPRIYDAEEDYTVMSMPTASGGATWPVAWPRSWGVVGESGIYEVNNGGTFPTHFRGRFTPGSSPVEGPRAENVTTGEVLDFNSLVLSPGQWLDIDSAEHTAYLNGEASRYGTLTPASRWFTLQPGINEIRLGADVAPTDATFTMWWRSAWI